MRKKIMCIGLCIAMLLFSSNICFVDTGNIVYANNNPIVYYQGRGQTWSNHSYGYGTTIASSGCGLLALTNAVYHLNGIFLNPTMLADFSLNNGYRVKNNGTSWSFFKGAALHLGNEYGFAFDSQTSSVTTLKTHLQSGGVATCRKPGHFMSIVKYDESTARYLLLDSAPNSSRGTSTGYSWKTATELSSVGINMYFLLSSASSKDVSNPQGVLDICSGDVGSINIRGWAFDEDDTSQAIPVHVYIGGPAGSVNAEGYPIAANTFRDDVNAVYGCGSYHGFDASISVSKTGEQPIYIYACNIGSGSTQLIAQKTVTITSPDTERPVISNARIENLTNEGYDVICNVTDNLNISRVQFVTWSEANGQDDIAPGWESNPIVTGTKNNNGEYVFHVNIAEHYGNRGLYSTHIYTYDDYGNYSGYPLTVTIPGYDYCFDEITLSDDGLYVKGWATAVNGFDNIKAILTDNDGTNLSYDITNRYYRSDIEAHRPGWNSSLAGFSETFDISKLKTGNITMKIMGTTDNSTYILYNKSIAHNDTESPVITNARVTNVTNQGYDVICSVADNVNVNRVQFATWSDANGQDDIAKDWENNPAVGGVKNSNGEYEFRVNIAEHDGNRGLYYTHIYAFDDSGNADFVPLTTIVPGYDAAFDSATLEQRNLTISGWATSINGIENLKMTVTDRKGKTAVYDITNRFNRADITALRPDWKTENAGYSQTFDLSDLASGSAVVEITGELYQEDISKNVYLLGKKVIDLKDNLSVSVSVNDDEIMVGEGIDISVNAIGAEFTSLNIYNEKGLYDTISIMPNTTYMKSFDVPGEYYVNAKVVGYEDSLTSNNVYFTIVEEPELEPEAEENDDIIVSEFSYQIEGENANVVFSALNVSETAIIYIASYDVNRTLLEVQAPKLINNSAKVCFDMKDVYNFKAFIWDDNLQPLALTQSLKP